MTKRIRLATTILLAPTRGSGELLGKQAATIQSISGGRLVVGVAVGGREDDYEASDVEFSSRGRQFDQMLGDMTRVWRDSGQNDAIGPDVSADPPKLVVGGSVDAAYRRAAQHGDGWIMGGGTPGMLAEGREKALAAWKEAGRHGEPRTMALAYYSLGPDAAENAQRELGTYYAFLGGYADQIVASAAKDGDTVKGYIQGFSEAGCDELVFFPCSPEAEQVELLASAAL